MRRIERELVHFARCLVEVTFKRRAASGSEVQESGERFAAPTNDVRQHVVHRNLTGDLQCTTTLGLSL